MSITETAPRQAVPTSESARHVMPAQDDGPRKSWVVLAVALTAQILVVLDISVVNTALPTIGNALRLRSGDLQWLVTAYLMMSGGGPAARRSRRRPGLPSPGLPHRNDAVHRRVAASPGSPRRPAS